MAPAIVLITGANGGIGKGLLETYLAKPNHPVSAAIRDPNHSTSMALADLPRGEGSSLIVIKLIATLESGAVKAVKELEPRGVVDHLDIVVCNAGVSYKWPRACEVKIEDFHGHVVPDVYGLL
ncbi:hypothetical protein DL769_009306 [Monosporascus sp. CRB-8-3]|nr:hypothetical protein DL769_009306 [Monosporascus sp. CRB-8-3]